MQHLSSNAYSVAHEFLGASPFTAESRSVTVGHSPGWAFVDDYLQPSVVIVGSKGMEGFWLFGNSEDTDLSGKVRSFAEGEGRKAMAEVGYGFLEMSTSDDGCRRALRDALSSWDAEAITCIILRSDRTRTLHSRRHTRCCSRARCHSHVSDRRY